MLADLPVGCLPFSIGCLTLDIGCLALTTEGCVAEAVPLCIGCFPLTAACFGISKGPLPTGPLRSGDLGLGGSSFLSGLLSGSLPNIELGVAR